MTERRQLRDKLLEEAQALPAGERATFLSQHCADEEMACELASLLALADASAETLTAPWQAPEFAGSSQPGILDRLGPYRVIRRLGQGGMGTVYECIRDDDQFRKRVAVKVVRGQSRTDQDLLRFRQERQILADLEHPNIARLLDGGSTQDGLPFIVMEFVEGEPITAYCAKRELSIADRLRLFHHVCDAVQYAHQNLIVHRDLKPSNILVSSAGVPKLLDFGIAKLLDVELAEAMGSPETATGLVMLTPIYASPEQIRGAPVSTASDVYSLGVILYELLAGRRPHELKSYQPADLIRISDQDPKPPSEWGLASLRGDLDTIVLKAMQREPARRYNSANQFAEDLRRYLAGLPILARPDTLTYRTGKFVRRHWLGIASIAAVVLALAAGIGVALREAHVAEERFNDVRTLANRFLFDFHDSIAGIEGTTKARELVVSTALEYLGRLGRSAANDRGLQKELAAAYVKVGRVQGFPGEPNLGRIADARKSLETAADLYQRARPVSAGDVEAALEPLGRLAYLESDQSNFDGSLEWSRRALNLAATIPLEQMTPALATAYALVRTRMSAALEGKGDSEAAYQAVREAERTLNQYAAIDSSGKFDRRPRAFLRNLESVARYSGRLEEALAAMEELLSKDGSTPAARAFYGARVSEVYASVDEPSWDDPAKALPLVIELKKDLERSLRTDPNDINTRYSLAVNNSKIGYYLRESDPREAVRAIEYTIRLFESMASQDPGNTEYAGRLSRYRARLALAQSYLHERAAVEALTSQALGDRSSGAGQVRLHVMNFCGLALVNVGNRAEARKVMQEAVRLSEELLAREGGRMGLQIEATRAFEQQAEFLRQSGDTAGAGRFLEQSRHIWQQREPATTYVRLRRDRAERLLAALRRGGPLR